MTQDFKDFVSSDSQTVLIATSVFDRRQAHLNNDYKCAKFGYDFLNSAGFVTCVADYPFSRKSLKQSVEDCLQFARNKTILSVDLWSSLQGSRQTPSDVAKDVVELYDLITGKSPNTQVGVISEGDPLYRDYRVEKIRELVPNHRIISSPSSAELSLLELYNLEDVRGLPVCKHQDSLVSFYNNTINVYTCLGLDYNKDLTSLIEKMTQSDTAYVIKLGGSKSIQKYSGAELKYLLELREFRVFLMDKTVLVYNRIDPK